MLWRGLRVLRRLYADELNRLDQHARAHLTTPA